jgi:putative glutamine amidotransferase
VPAPTIAILVGREPEHRYSLHRGYVDAVWAAGAVPVVLTPPPDGAVARFVDAVVRCDGLVLSGGGDVDPAAYGETARLPLMHVDADRDRAELAATEAALAARRPVLGICRGIQVLAVAHGGTLHQDLVADGFTSHWFEERQHEAVHAVRTEPGSLAAEALAGAGTVNSIHHQSVRHPGAGLTPTAWSDDGVIEAVEADGVLGVQWHPERLWDSDARHLAPFAWLVKRAS